MGTRIPTLPQYALTESLDAHWNNIKKGYLIHLTVSLTFNILFG
jgi:hypothetical protein